MNNKPTSPIKKNLEEIYQTAKKGISKENKDYLLSELEEMAKSIEEWKANNLRESPKKKAS